MGQLDYRSDDRPAVGLERLERIPFWYGLARGGRHTFLKHNGVVSEFHYVSDPDDADAITEEPLAEFDWLSGVIMVPPGSWSTDTRSGYVSRSVGQKPVSPRRPQRPPSVLRAVARPQEEQASARRARRRA